MIVVNDQIEIVFNQGTPSSTWVIDHNMDCHPSITVIDSAGNTVEGSIKYDTTNRVTISFTSGFSGKVILR